MQGRVNQISCGVTTACLYSDVMLQPDTIWSAAMWAGCENVLDSRQLFVSLLVKASVSDTTDNNEKETEWWWKLKTHVGEGWDCLTEQNKKAQQA